MAEFFLLILMVVAFCVWLHHKTNGFSSLKNSQGCRKCYKQTDWEEFDNYLSDSYLYDPGNPRSRSYNFKDTFPFIKED